MTKRSQIAVAITVAAVGALTLNGCAPAVEPAGTIRVGYGALPESWAPGAQMEPGYMRVPFETLLAFDAEGALVPNLATEWTANDDGTELTVELRGDVSFHDGEPFDAEAVKVNIEAVRDTPGPLAGPLQGVEVTAVDDDTVVFGFTRPTPSFPTTLAARNVPIMSPAAIESGLVQTQPVGTGPWGYVAEESVAGSVAVFRAVDDYWGARPAVETLELYGIADDAAMTAGLLGGEIDIADTTIPERPAFEGTSVETFTFPAIRNQVTFFDRGPGGAFELKEVRQAMCHAIDKEAWTALDENYETRTQHFVEGNYGFNPELTDYEFDLEKSAALLASVGNPSVSAEVITAPFTNRQTTVFVDGMNQLDNVAIERLEGSVPEWQSSWNNGAIFGLGLGANDELTPYDWYTAWFAADAPANVSGLESAELKAAADAAIAAGIAPEAEALWQEVLAVIQDEALACGHMGSQQIIAYASDRVAGVEPTLYPFEQNSIDYRALTVVDASE